MNGLIQTPFREGEAEGGSGARLPIGKDLSLVFHHDPRDGGQAHAGAFELAVAYTT